MGLVDMARHAVGPGHPGTRRGYPTPHPELHGDSLVVSSRFRVIGPVAVVHPTARERVARHNKSKAKDMDGRSPWATGQELPSSTHTADPFTARGGRFALLGFPPHAVPASLSTTTHSFRGEPLRTTGLKRSRDRYATGARSTTQTVRTPCLHSDDRQTSSCPAASRAKIWDILTSSRNLQHGLMGRELLLLNPMLRKAEERMKTNAA